MHYAEARDWLDSLGEFHMEFGLDRVRAILAELGNPERFARVIHVAGTNGKGMTCAYAASMLRHDGVKVGLYTSPHLSRPNERIAISGEPIEDSGFAAAISAVRDGVGRSTKLTYFEAITCAAFVAFREAGVGASVIEVGLGGRLDATNVVDPVVSVITHVSLDHTALLGTTVEEIAAEKAGIVKPGRPVVVPSGEPHVQAAVAAKHAGGRIWVCGHGGEVGLDRGGVLRLPGDPAGPLHVWGPPEAVRQTAAGMAAVAVRILDPAIPAGAIDAGMRNAAWPGRGESLEWTDGLGFLRRVHLDGAHNPAAAAALPYERREPQARVVILFAAMADKDYAGILRALGKIQPFAIVCTSAGTARSATPRTLAEAARAIHGDAIVVEAVEPIEDALDRAAALGIHEPAAPPEILVTGSLYLVGRVRERITRGPPTALG